MTETAWMTDEDLNEVDSINARDLKGQGEGEMHLIRGGHLVRVNSFISGGWKSQEDYERWLEEDAQAKASWAAKVEAQKRNSIVGRLKSLFSRQA